MNDTFLISSIAQNSLTSNIAYDINYADIESINQLCLNNRGDLNKISISCLGSVLDQYQLLPVGVTLGYKNGPKLIAKKQFDLDQLPRLRIGIPGFKTTAYFLYRTLLPSAKEVIELPYNELSTRLLEGKIDSALVIHDTRFELQAKKLIEVCDIFDLWAHKTKLPLPLGGLVVKRSLGQTLIAKINEQLQQSLREAYKQRQKSLEFVKKHNPKLTNGQIEQNLELYVNSETQQLSPLGQRSILAMLQLGKTSAYFSQWSNDWLFRSKSG